MIISYSKKFIFIHIDKTAGTSINTSLIKYGWYPEESFLSTLMKRLGNRYYSEEFYSHIRAGELKKIIPPKVYDNFFKFAFIRNPWDWMLSNFTFFLKNKNMHPHVYFKNEILTLKDFIKWQTDNRYAFHTQSEYIMDEQNNLLVDYLGRFESLEAEFEKICKIIGIREDLPHTNLSKESGYTGFYDPETKDLVYKHYKQDIERFGYEF